MQSAHSFGKVQKYKCGNFREAGAKGGVEKIGISTELDAIFG